MQFLEDGVVFEEIIKWHTWALFQHVSNLQAAKVKPVCMKYFISLEFIHKEIITKDWKKNARTGCLESSWAQGAFD